MPKRTNTSRIEFYKNKLKKLEEKESRAAFRRRIIMSDSEDDQGSCEDDCEPVPEPTPEPCEESVSALLPCAQTCSTTEPDLDPLLLQALGESSSDSPDFGESIHDNLVKLWTPLLKKGIPKEIKERLLKEHLVPDNCRLLQAPKLNAEISAAIAETTRGCDKKYVTVQQQLGQGISAINRAMNILLKGDNKVESLKFLSDGCRILSDLHNFFTRDRIKLITPSLDKNFFHIIQDCERDETLFGNSLGEKIKASKAIEKQGQLIKKAFNNKPTSTATSSTRPTAASQGNFRGPSRYPSSNRGGRGGPRRSYQPPTRRSYNLTQSKQQNKPRAPPASTQTHQ